MKIKEFHLEAFSNPYYGFIEEFAQSEYESAKLLGKFYTDYSVAKEMIGRVTEKLPETYREKELRIIDPFCGDGRLVAELLRELSKRKNCKDVEYRVTLWDVDENALENAKTVVSSVAEMRLFFMLIWKSGMQISWNRKKERNASGNLTVCYQIIKGYQTSKRLTVFFGA